MKRFRIVPEIYQYSTCREFAEEFRIGEGDLIFTNPTYFERYFSGCTGEAKVIYARNYGCGEPTDEMVDKIGADLKKIPFRRLIAVGGGSIIDVAKLLALKEYMPLEALFDGRMPVKKEKELILVPTTCGTGSEVTSVSVIKILNKGVKLGLQTDEEFADAAVLIPELLEGLPRKVFAASSIDALIHATESFLSPKASEFSELYSRAAIASILSGYREIIRDGRFSAKKQGRQFLTASTWAGIAFGNAGCAAVHAMSMSYSGTYHVPHGESNYVLFTEVLKRYLRLKPQGKIRELAALLAGCLDCEEGQVCEKLDELLGKILEKKKLKDYGVEKEKLPEFVEMVMEQQKRLTVNNYTELSREEMLSIYEAVYA